MASIPMYEWDMARTPRQAYTALECHGVKLTGYRDGGSSQPLSDWFQYEGLPMSLLEKPWRIYEDMATNSLVIEQ